MVLSIAMIDSTRGYRLARAVGLNIVVMDYIEAARLRGEGLWYLIRREILPNSTAPLIAEFGLEFCFVFLLVAGLSFLGLGVQPPTPSWGLMVSEGKQMLLFQPWMIAIPGVALFILVLAINLLGDGLRDVSAPENRN